MLNHLRTREKLRKVSQLKKRSGMPLIQPSEFSLQREGERERERGRAKKRVRARASKRDLSLYDKHSTEFHVREII